MTRTLQERQADDFDMRLYRLVRLADQAAYWARGDRRKEAKWCEVRDGLRHLRPTVRSMMSDADRKATV